MSKAFDRRRFRAMLVKETLQIMRDPSTFLIAFVTPVLLIFLFGFGVNLDTARSKIGLSLQDRSEAASSLAGTFQTSRYFQVVQTGDVAQLRQSLIGGKINGFIVIPQNFGQQALRGGGTIEVVTDGSSPNSAAFVGNYAEGLRASWAAARLAERGVAVAPPVSINARMWFNPELTSRYFLVPGSMAVVMTIIGALLTALIIAREWERGTMEAIMATPVGRVEFLLTKIIPYFVMGLGSMTLCTLIAIFVFGVPFRGSFFALFIIASAYLIPSLGQGLFISSVTKNQFMASQIALLTGFLPAMLLSGFLYELSSTPKWVQLLSYLIPARYLIPQLQTVFLAGDNWSVFLPRLAALLGFGAFFFYRAYKSNRWRIA